MTILSCASTSGSFYLQIVGPAGITDSCWFVGSVYTNPTVPVPIESLSTISPNLSIGAMFRNVNGDREGIGKTFSYTKAVRTEDLREV